MSAMDTEVILAAIAALGVRIDAVGERLERRIDDLAEITGRNFERVQGDVARLEASVQRVESAQSSLRHDFSALRTEIRRGFDRNDARLDVLEGRRA